MHLQLPGTLKPTIEVEAQEVPPIPAVALDRIVLIRRARKVKFYLRKNTFKRCYSDLSEEQMKGISSAIRTTGQKKAENFVFEDDIYLVTPETKRSIV